MADKRWFVLFDGRAKGGDTDDASVLDTAQSEQQARSASHNWRGVDAIWFEYKEIDKGTGEEVGPRHDLGKGVLL